MPEKRQKKKKKESTALKWVKGVVNNGWLTGFIALFGIGLAIFDKAKEYITSWPPWGTDFLMPISSISFFKEHLSSLPLWGWNYLGA